MTTASTTWIVGPIAWDTILHFEKYPVNGKFALPYKTLERVGGSPANTVKALATTGISAGFVTGIGEDPLGEVLRQSLLNSQLSKLDIIKGVSQKCLVFLDETGERTIIPYGEIGWHLINLNNTPLEPGDTVFLPGGSENALSDLKIAKERGCKTIVGIQALLNPSHPGADIALGSTSDLPDEINPEDFLDRFPRIVYTRGVKGVDQYERGGVIHQDAFPAKVIDTTGAGDAFTAGYLAGLAKGYADGRKGLEAGARWAALMVTLEASVPPNWSTVPGSHNFF